MPGGSAGSVPKAGFSPETYPNDKNDSEKSIGETTFLIKIPITRPSRQWTVIILTEGIEPLRKKLCTAQQSKLNIL